MTAISRRDFLNGLLWTGVGLGWPATVLRAWADEPDRYPPALTGLRGAHPGAFEAAHALAFGGQRDFGPLAAPAERYDLIVIGAGISGLAAAYFYRQRKPAAKVLILDNHDDFGGHAKRNEFSVDGHWLLAYGGTQSIDTPSAYSKVASQLLRELGVELEALEEAYDMDFFGRYGLGPGVFYDAASFGRAALLPGDLPTRRPPGYYPQNVVPGLRPGAAFASTLAKAPLSEAQRRQLADVLAVPAKVRAWFAGTEGRKRFFGQTYVAYLKAVYGITDPALLALLSMPLAEETALGGTGISLPTAVAGQLLGLPPASFFAPWLESEDREASQTRQDDEPYVHHFPDGNATLARLLVRKLIPAVAKAGDPAQCLTARFDYAQLDRPQQPVRLRLSSLAVEADNVGGGTRVRYLRDGKLYEAQATHTVMAGWHMMAAHIIPSLPATQKAAMRANIKMPMVYAQVALRQWRPLQKSGVGAAYCPGSYFQFVQMDYPVNMGDYQPERTPDQPTVLLMIRMPCPALGEGSVPDLLRAGRADLLGTAFATFEQQIRQQLQAMYGPHGFDAGRDIAAITVNRWPHGYVWEDAEYQGQPAHVLARRRHGNIAMANADAAGRAYTDAAIDMAWRAIGEVFRK